MLTSALTSRLMWLQCFVPSWPPYTWRLISRLKTVFLLGFSFQVFGFVTCEITHWEDWFAQTWPRLLSIFPPITERAEPTNPIQMVSSVIRFFSFISLKQLPEINIWNDFFPEKREFFEIDDAKIMSKLNIVKFYLIHLIDRIILFWL